MKIKLLILSLGLWAVAAQSEQVVQILSWNDLRRSGPLPSGLILDDNILKLENTNFNPLYSPVAIIEKPAIQESVYALTGEVRYEGVEGRGYLEMWSHFPDGGAYFSRTLADSGPMSVLEGSSPWRPFILPFNNKEGGPAPAKLVFNVVLLSRGTVYMRSVHLVQFAKGQNPLAASPGAWWTPSAAGLIGVLSGLLGGSVGILMGLLVPRGKARRLILVLLAALIVLGIAFLLIGLFAWMKSQPYHVFYPLLLIGVLFPVLFGWFLVAVPRWYAQVELRKIAAADTPE